MESSIGLCVDCACSYIDILHVLGSTRGICSFVSVSKRAQPFLPLRSLKPLPRTCLSKAFLFLPHNPTVRHKSIITAHIVYQLAGMHVTRLACCMLRLFCSTNRSFWFSIFSSVSIIHYDQNIIIAYEYRR